MQLHRWNVGGCDDYYLTDSNLCSIQNASSLYEASWCSRKLWETITWCCDTSHLDSAGNMSRGCYTIRIHTSPFITSHQITRRSLRTHTVPTSQTSYHFSSLDPHETMLAQYWLWPCVHLSVSVTTCIPSKNPDELLLAWRFPSTYRSQCYKEIQVSENLTVLPQHVYSHNVLPT